MSWILYLIPLSLLLLWFSSRYAWWSRAVDYRYPRILMYHMVREHIPDARFNGLRVTPENFEMQMKWLHDNGWTSYTITELVQQWDSLPQKSVALTFDDGYEDNLLNALPVLKKYNIKATLYLVVERFNRDWSVYKKSHHDSGELKNEAKLSNGQMQEMLDSGLIELASHTLTHPDFSKQDDELKQHELSESRKVLGEVFAVPINSFAYPFGIYSEGDRELVRAAGYSSAVTTDAGIDAQEKPDFLQLKRVKISGKDNMLAFKLRMRRGIRGWKK